MKGRASLSAEAQGRAASLLSWVSAALFGVMAFALATTLGEQLTVRRLVLMGTALSLVCVALLSGQTKRLALFAWVISLTYVRTYYVFDGANQHGYQGFYLIAADGPLLLLVGIWLYEVVVQKQPLVPRGSPFLLWYLPWLAAGVLSISGADRPEWSAFELIRLIKLGVILLYVRYNFGRTEVVLCLTALAFAVILQGGESLLQVTPTRFAADPLPGESWIRARGTMIHPNIMGAYLLLLVPMFIALIVAAAPPVIPWVVSAGAALAGLFALAFAMSRVPWVILFVQLVALAVVLSSYRLVRLPRLIGLMALGTLVVALAAIPVREKLIERIRGNLVESVKFRQDFNRVALTMFWKSPAFGVGLNNFEVHRGRLKPELDEFINQTQATSGRLQRVVVAVHNVYLLVLAETGLFGLGAWIWFLFGSIAHGMRAVRRTSGPWRVVSCGLLIGVVGILGQQLTEFALWVDANLFTFALVAGVLANLPQVSHAEPDDAAGSVWRIA